MNNNRRKYTIALVTIMMLMLFASCKSVKNDAPMAQTSSVETNPTSVLLSQFSKAMPKAVVYRTNGNYNNYVMVTVNRPTNSLISYPDPHDISATSAPLELGDGWLLDRRGGVSRFSVFLNYTYPEYADLDKAPSHEEIMDHIIPNASVTEIMTLPISAADAINNPQLVKKYLDMDK